MKSSKRPTSGAHCDGTLIGTRATSKPKNASSRFQRHTKCWAVPTHVAATMLQGQLVVLAQGTRHRGDGAHLSRPPNITAEPAQIPQAHLLATGYGEIEATRHRMPGGNPPSQVALPSLLLQANQIDTLTRDLIEHLPQGLPKTPPLMKRTPCRRMRTGGVLTTNGGHRWALLPPLGSSVATVRPKAQASRPQPTAVLPIARE